MKTTITITIDADKLDAIRQFSGKDKASLENEIDALIERVYQKRVPSMVRQFIENRAENREQEASPKRTKRANSGGNPAQDCLPDADT